MIDLNSPDQVPENLKGRVILHLPNLSERVGRVGQWVFTKCPEFYGSNCDLFMGRHLPTGERFELDISGRPRHQWDRHKLALFIQLDAPLRAENGGFPITPEFLENLKLEKGLDQ